MLSYGLKEIKISHSKSQKGKRKGTPYDETWVDSFDPRPKKNEKLCQSSRPGKIFYKTFKN